MCDGKQVFTSQGKAAKFLDKIDKRGLMHSYECPYCYTWHIGHKAKDAKRYLNKKHHNPLTNPFLKQN